MYEGASYTFTPTVSSGGSGLVYSIVNKPSWASFDTATGALTGTPGAEDVGTTTGIIVSVSNGTTTAALSSFSITVKSSSALLSWTAPTTHSDGSPLSLSELAGYRIYMGSTSDNLSLLIDLDDPTVTEHHIDNLAIGTYYFAVTAYNYEGTESERSEVVSKTIH